MRSILVVAALGGCTQKDDPFVPGQPPPTSTFVGTQGTGETGDTAVEPTTPTVDPDCLVELPTNVPYTTASITTEEDFDFDDRGLLLRQLNTSLAGTSRDGEETIVAANIGVDAAGIRVLADGNVAIAQPDTGVIRVVDRSTGGSAVLLSGLQFPNGMEVSPTGELFISEFVTNGAVKVVDTTTGDFEVVINTPSPNGMTVSPDGAFLYIVTSTGGYGGDGKIARLERGVNGKFDKTTAIPFYSSTEALDGISTDKCGNVYVMELQTGHMLRISPDGSSIEGVADLGNGFQFPSMRFGSGFGDWARDVLFVTSRQKIYAVEVGIEGKEHVTISANP